MGRTLAQGQVFAGYRIERLLGAGGMGEVYLARDRDLPRFTALKVLNPAIGDSEGARRRFLLEADTVARLSHPNIVTVYARGQEGDRLWMAMQYVEGTDVAAVLQNGPIHPEHAVTIVGEAAKALDFAHRAGVLHRDVKPANILLAQDASQQVLLADFGIAKLMDHTSNLTHTGEVHASFRYAAPEQLDSTVAVDQRADVYALGCTLFHMLTGVPPFPGTAPSQLIHGHLNLPVPQPSRQSGWLPTGFDAVIARAMAKNPHDRFGSCGELATAARHVLHGSTSGGSTPTPNAKSGKGSTVAAVTAALALAIAGGAAGFVWYHNKSENEHARSAHGARDQACAFSRVMLSLDYNDFQSYRKAVLDGSTGELKDKLTSQMETFEKTSAQNHSRTRATDVQCFTKNTDPDQVDVAVFTNQSYTNDLTPVPASQQSSMMLTMQFVDGRWLAAKSAAMTPEK
ncbi:serine/threonine-protein kinase [Nocardia elegans]|uniref:serine/threonine-protein kinase n=1 Tax=Nocardia elegans TaxID=300029 RepID=UPI002B4ACFC3|nr:serine/threonine-protein kinase [Nocardia elegans]